MTVGLFVNDPVPLLISDCLVTRGDQQDGAFSPSNFDNMFGCEGAEAATLRSKYIFLDETAAITFAGRYDHIVDFCQESPRLWADHDKKRPMKFLKEIDYQLRVSRNNWECGVLGVSFVDIDQDLYSNTYASPNQNWKFKTGNFGFCSAIGSGGEAIRNWLMQYDSNILRLVEDAPNRDTTEWGIYGIPAKLVGALNGAKLFGAPDNRTSTWGGILQANYFSVERHAWFRFPTWFYFAVRMDGKDLGSAGIHQKQVLHRPTTGSAHESELYVWLNKNDGSSHSHAWKIFSPFHGQTGLARSCALDFPNYALVTISVQLDFGGRTNLMHQTYGAHSLPGVSISTDNAGWRISQKELIPWLQEEVWRDLSLLPAES